MSNSFNRRTFILGVLSPKRYRQDVYECALEWKEVLHSAHKMVEAMTDLQAQFIFDIENRAISIQFLKALDKSDDFIKSFLEKWKTFKANWS